MNDKFRWENIALNTWVMKIPIGWILKSIDTKHIIKDENEVELNEEEIKESQGENENKNKKVTLAMSNSMITIIDPEHGWNFESFRWVNVTKDTWRAKIAGGWIIKSVDTRNIDYLHVEQVDISSSMAFIPDPTYRWNVKKPQPSGNIK